MKKRFICLAAAALSLLLVLGGCGAEESVLKMAAAGPYVDEEKLQEYADSVSLQNGEKLTATGMLLVSGTEDQAADLMGATNLMKISAMIAGQELDVMLCDKGSAETLAKNGSFLPVSEFLTAEELKKIGEDRLIAYESPDGEDQPAGETDEPCGIDVTGRKEFQNFLASDEIGVYVVANTKNRELAKEYVLSIAE